MLAEITAVTAHANGDGGNVWLVPNISNQSDLKCL